MNCACGQTPCNHPPVTHTIPLRTTVVITVTGWDRLKVALGHRLEVQLKSDVTMDCLTSKTVAQQHSTSLTIHRAQGSWLTRRRMRRPFSEAAEVFTAQAPSSHPANPYPAALRALSLRIAWGVPAAITLIAMLGAFVDRRFHLGHLAALSYGFHGLRRMRKLAERGETVNALLNRAEPTPEAPPPATQAGP